MSDLAIYLNQALEKNGYDYSPEIQAKLVRYLEILQEWNQIMNLTAVRNPEDMVWRHILDSLSIIPYVIKNRLIDVGSGAGLPGIPLAIIHPEKEVWLLDSNNKKIRFLTQVVAELALKNVSIAHTRAEQLKPQQRFDYVITRAFSSLKDMLKMTQHLIHRQGEFLAMKGVYPEAEIKEIPKSFKVTAVHELKIKGLDHQRCLVIIQEKTRLS